MSWHFHDWTLWSEPKGRVIATYDKPLVFNDAKPVDMAVMIQERTCHKCGKYQWRKV